MAATKKALDRSALEALGFDLESITEDVNLMDTVTRTRSSRFRVGEPTLQRVIYEWVPAPAGTPEDTLRSGVDTWSKEMSATITLLPGARFNSISQKVQPRSSGDGSDMWVVNGVLYNVGFDISLEIPGAGSRTLTELLLDITNATTGAEMDLPGFIAFCHKYGFYPDGRMYLQFQHMNADEEKTLANFDLLERLGMVDRLGELEDPRSIQRRVGFAKREQGFEVREMAMSGFNRNVSQNKTGFIDLVNAQIENYWLWRQLRTEAAALHKATVEPAKPLSDKKVKENLARVRDIETLSRTWINSWGGRHRQMEPSPTGEGLVPTDIIYADNVGVGTLVINDGEDDHTLDFWVPQEQTGGGTTTRETRRAKASATKKAASTERVDTTTGGDSPFADEEPF